MAVSLTKIADFKNGMTITGFFLVKNAAVKASSNGKSMYGDYTLADDTGEINAKIWDVVDADACPRAGGVIKAQGLVNEWQGRLQLRIDRFREAESGDDFDLESLIPSAPEDPRSMLTQIQSYAKRIREEEVRVIVEYLLEENEDRLLIWPAALKNHHSVRAGLLYHTLTMLRMGESMAAIYPLNTDLLFAGVILHDIAKVDELSAAMTGIATEYTVEGQLLGHITQGVLLVDRAGQALGADQNTITLLQHMLLAHHYEPEFGSPRRPMFPEAEALHYLDILDAHMFDMAKALDEVDEGGFTERLWTLHNRQLYKIPQKR
jgi:3'-5' exoribonuclease